MQNHSVPISHNSYPKKLCTYEEQLSRSTARWILVLVLILGGAFRLVLLGANDLWYDELFTIFASRIPLKVLWRITPHYTAPPFFYIILKAWLSITETLLHPRMFSVLWGLGGIYLSYLLGRRLLSREIGLLSALIVALAPFHIRYSLELRMYIMQTTLLTAETLVLLSALRKGTVLRWGGYGLLLAFNLAIKYQSVFYCISEVLFVLLYALLSGRRQLLRNVLIAVGIGVVFLSPVIWIAVQQIVLADFSLAWVPASHPLDILRCFLITFIYYMIAFHESWWMWTLSAVLAVTILIFNIKQWKGQKEQFALMLLVCIGILPPAIMYLISIAGFRIFFLVRYVIISLVPFSILLSAGILKIRWRGVRYSVLIILLLVLMGSSLVQSIKPWTPSWTTLTNVIDTYVKDD
ncbi:glycosyltransferase family 39 protein, partial [Candidatus Sumerlaeota bacterium]|nr:glycosyltransferase family 39 protein [Candidatus Sumerlaeota bacterium]